MSESDIAALLLESVIRDNLGEKTLQRIKIRLFEKYHISLAQSVDSFEKLDSVLREFFGEGAERLEKRTLISHR